MRISATNIEAFRRWLVNEAADSQELIDYLLKKNEPSHAMKAGSAFHKVLEHQTDHLETAEMDGFHFDFSKLEDEVYLPDMREIKFEVPYYFHGQTHTLVCVIDAMDSVCLFDHKLTNRIDAEAYIDSFQWRCYLSWLGYSQFTYNLFQGFASTNTPFYYEIREWMPITFYRYDGMDAEVETLVDQFIEFVHTHHKQLTEFIARK